MPYFLRGKCVWKGTKEDPIEEVKCHPTRKKALAHLAALYIHVEDVINKDDTGEYAYPMAPIDTVPNSTVGAILNSKIHGSFTLVADMLYGFGYLDRDERIRLSGAIGDSLDVLEKTIRDMGLTSRRVLFEHANMIAPVGLYMYKEESNGVWKDRWIAVSTKEMWDAEGEMFTKEAMDYDLSYSEQTGKYPELRLYHVRGFKLGECDSMSRIREYGIDQGYWYDTPLAQAMKEIVAKNEGRWKISRGFHAVEASGLCPDCGVGLTVRPLNFIVGTPCPACGTWVMPSKLKQLKHLKARTFDITITDVPAVSATAVAAYSIK